MKSISGKLLASGARLSVAALVCSFASAAYAGVKYWDNPDFKAKKVNLSLPLGLSYEYKNLSLDLRYNLGLTNVWDYVNSTEKNRTIMITLGYGVEL